MSNRWAVLVCSLLAIAIAASRRPTAGSAPASVVMATPYGNGGATGHDLARAGNTSSSLEPACAGLASYEASGGATGHDLTRAGNTSCSLGPACAGLASYEAKRRVVAVCFFGINRSLRFTVASIRSMLLDPLRDACFAPEIYAHTYSLNFTLVTPRSNESAGLPVGGAAEIRELLAPYELEVTDQAEFWRSWEAAGHVLQKGSSFDRHSTRNLLCQLNSLVRVTRLWMPRAHMLHAVMYVRPDLRMLQPFDTVALAGVQQGELYVPFWACWRGLNDRFAFGRPAAAAAYGQRLLLAQDFARTQKLHSERLVLYALRAAGITPRFTSSQSVRVRATGLVERQDKRLVLLSDLGGELCTPADPRGRCAPGRCNLTALGGTMLPATTPRLCAYIPEYGSSRRQVLVVLHGGLSGVLDRQRVLAIEQMVLGPLRKACVVYILVASLRADAQTVRATIGNATSDLSRLTGLPFQGVTLVPCVGHAAHEHISASSSTHQLALRCSWVQPSVWKLVAQFSGRVHTVVCIALDSSMARPLDALSLLSVQGGEVFTSADHTSRAQKAPPFLAYARLKTAEEILATHANATAKANGHPRDAEQVVEAAWQHPPREFWKAWQVVPVRPFSPALVPPMRGRGGGMKARLPGAAKRMRPAHIRHKRPHM